MKKLLLSIAILVASAPVFAQSLQIEDLGGNIISNQTIDLWYDQTYATYSQDFNVRNISGSTKKIMAERHQVFINTPGYELFCWVLCYGPNTNVSPTAASMNANAVHVFSSHYFHSNTNGISTVIYTFYDSLNMADSARFTVNWHITPTGVNNLGPVSGNISAVYPNPASSNTSINYSLNNAHVAYLKVFDLLGNELRQMSINPKEGIVNLNVADLKAGIYFCSIIADEKAISTQKLTIVR